MAKTVLIIDDEPRITLALATRLRVAGYEVASAASGLDGVNAAARCRPDIILLDIRLPDMDGYEVCRRLRQMPELDRVPIIFLSAHSQECFRKRAIEMGGSLFMSKPYEARDVLAALSRLTERNVAAEQK